MSSKDFGPGVPEQSSLMLSTSREQHLGLTFISRKTFELFQIELFPFCSTRTRIVSFLTSLNPAVFLVCRVNKRSSQLFGSLGNPAVQENQTKHLNALKLFRQQSDSEGPDPASRPADAAPTAIFLGPVWNTPATVLMPSLAKVPRLRSWM